MSISPEHTIGFAIRVPKTNVNSRDAVIFVLRTVMKTPSFINLIEKIARKK